MNKKWILFLACQQVWAVENVTIYNGNLALIHETREIELKEGFNRIELPNVSSHIMSETVKIKANQEIEVLEQNFDFDLLNEDSLINKYIGKKVKIISANGMEEEATILANNGGVILKYDNRIESGLPKDARMIFSEIPSQLKERPTLSVNLNAKENKKTNLDLTYLTGGLNWAADYVVDYHPEKNLLDLTGWVTLHNRSGKQFTDANLQLVAGEVNRAPRHAQAVRYAAASMEEMAVQKRMAAPVSEEALFEYHLYSLNRPTTINDNQSKQVQLLEKNEIPVEKNLIIRPHFYYDSDEKINAQAYLEFKNEQPMPAGIVRVYQNDKQDKKQFIGEDRIEHTAKGDKVKLKMGEAFDIYARLKITDYKRLDKGISRKEVHQKTVKVTLSNGKDTPEKVKLLQDMPSEWSMIKESHPHEKIEQFLAQWTVEVPANGEVIIEYTVKWVN